MYDFQEFSLVSDTGCPAHPAILAAVGSVNEGYAAAYGDDEVTAAAKRALCEIFGGDIDVYFAFSGTGANVFALAALAGRSGAAVCPATAHIGVHEAAACEGLAGVKLLCADTADGKLRVADVERYAALREDIHCPRPDLISISQVTECGTVYTQAELEALCRAAHAHGMAVHMDGARFANAVAATGLPPRAISRDAGVDVLTLGGTKNGFLFGEAVIFFNKDASGRYARLQKQFLQLASKNRFIAAQFVAALENGLWLDMAKRANDAAARLASGLSQIDGMALRYPADANMVFMRASGKPLERAVAMGLAAPGEPDGVLRMVASWGATDAQIDAFVEHMRG